jgi:hypothetical protein
VILSGTGFDFTVGLNGLSSATVSSGQQADYTLVLTPEAAQGTFTFQCGTLPSNTLCLFNPTTETLALGVQGNVTVEIYTGQTGLTVRAERPAGKGAALPLLCGLLFLPCALIRHRKALLLAALVAILVGSVSSCTSSGGGTGRSSGQASSTGSPAGTYTIPVTVTASGVSHSVTVTLTVD